MRLFLGSFATIDCYDAIQKDFSMLHARWTPKQNIHLTYLFLGEKYEPDFIIKKLENIEYHDKIVQIAGVATFGKPPHILYAKVEDKTLTNLHNNIAQRLDLKPERDFIPHITLARIKKIRNFPAFTDMIENYKDKKLGFMQIKLQLIASELTPQGALYTTIYDF